MAIFFFALVVIAPVFVMVIWTKQQKKRGCGRGCATCGNRDICYRNEKKPPVSP